MNCISCGNHDGTGAGLCPHHQYALPDGWARANRIACDLFHRGIEPPHARDMELVGAEMDPSMYLGWDPS